MPINAIYNGLNVLMLWNEREEKQYRSAEWCTYKQCQEAGGQVRAGERSTQVIYVNKTTVGEGEDERLVPFMRLFSVFNVQQCDGLEQNEWRDCVGRRGVIVSLQPPTPKGRHFRRRRPLK
jgi:antirestriction protein ArdC